MTDDDVRPLASYTHGDDGAQRHLRANLAAYARAADDPDTRDLVRDVLAGRRGLGDLLTTERFEQTGQRHLDNLLAGVEALEPEQRERALAVTRPDAAADDLPDHTDDASLAALRDAAVPDDGWASEDAGSLDPPR